MQSGREEQTHNEYERTSNTDKQIYWFLKIKLQK